MMKSDNQQALIDLVRSLEYEKPETLSNWVRDIIKDKENFAKLYVVEAKSEFGGRPEKFLVNNDAKILVDNLCLLKPYVGLFGKSTNDDKALAVYRHLKKGDCKTKLDAKFLTLKKKLRVEKAINDTAIENLMPFSKVLASHTTIDITSQSLRALMQAEVDGNDVIDFSRSIDITAWNELVALKDQLLEGDEGNSIIYCQIGERLIELGDQREALVALKKATEIDESNGIAWALQAKLYLDLLLKSRREQMEALARTDFSGFVEFPLDAEEYWINERIEETYVNSESFRGCFVTTSVLALINWPCFDYKNGYSTNSKGIKCRNFQPNLNIAHDCSFDLKRDWLFAHLVINLQKDDFNDALKRDFLTIFCDFQRNDPEMYPMPNLHLGMWGSERHLEYSYQIDIIKVLSWYYPEQAQLALQILTGQIRERDFRVEEHLAILNSSSIRQLIWQYLGQAEFNKLYRICEQYRFKAQQEERVTTICGLQFNEVFACFSALNKVLKHNETIEQGYMPSRVDKPEPVASEVIKKSLEQSIIEGKKLVEGWRELIKDPLWQATPYSQSLPSDMLAIIFFGALLELYLGEAPDFNISILLGFTADRLALKVVINALSFLLLKCIFETINENETKAQLDLRLMPIWELIVNVQEEIEDEELEYSLQCLF